MIFDRINFPSKINCLRSLFIAHRWGKMGRAQKKRRKNTKKHIIFGINGNIKKKKREIHNQRRVTWGFFMYEERRKRK